jgi:ABC-type transport system involved in multi-copper enzyme maturation permease subunit
MRQVQEVAVSLSLSIISFVSLILTVFLGVNLVYRDIEKRLAHTVVSLPISRESYLVGKFIGLLWIVGAGMVLLSLFSVGGITIASLIHPSSVPMRWENFVAAVFFEYLALSIVASFAVFFSSFSTNIFLPLFATIGMYVAGGVTQTVMEYLRTSYAKDLPAASMYLSKVAYYIFPNLSAFDLKFHAIYNLELSVPAMATTFLYAVLYITVVVCCSLLVFRKRELA